MYLFLKRACDRTLQVGIQRAAAECLMQLALCEPGQQMLLLHGEVMVGWYPIDTSEKQLLYMIGNLV